VRPQATWEDILTQICNSRTTTLVPWLPKILTLHGQPYHLKDHFPFEPIFRTDTPERVLLKSGRQLSKSTNLAAKGVVLSVCIPNFTVLYVMPLYTQTRRLSNNYVRPFLEESPYRNDWLSDRENSVLQRTLRNNSKMIFSYSFLDITRLRGISSDFVGFDEIQDLDYSFVPIIQETLSHSRYSLELYAGTPKTLDNTLQALWTQSSQAEWAIPCLNCRHLNVPSRDQDIYKMIGHHTDVSEAKPGIICARCARPIFPRQGRWVHRYPQRRWDFAGYHIPQIILPVHYADPRKWKRLLAKREGRNNMSEATFANEVLGEACDTGTKLISIADLQRAADLPWRNDPLGRQTSAEVIQAAASYSVRVLGVDWGGGGQKGQSFTKLALVGARGGRLDVIWGAMLLEPSDHLGEAQYVLRTFQQFNCQYVAHDFNGSGALRETLLVQAGIPIEMIIPIAYHPGVTQDLMVYHAPAGKHGRPFWILDKARSLLTTVAAIKLGITHFFAYDYENEDNPGLIHDFLALCEERYETPRGMDSYRISRDPARQDDFAHAVNFACCAIWHRYGWPDLALAARLQSELPLGRPPQNEPAIVPTENFLSQW
jgi:hypothetical protein